MLLVGVDPGLSGAIAIYDTYTGAVETSDMPVHQIARGGKVKRDIDIHALADLLRGQRLGHAFVEQVSSMPRQGVSSVFAFGQALGIAKAVIDTVGIPRTMVNASTWKKHFKIPAAKDAARARASQLFPAAADQWRLAKHDGRAEAALIALWGHHSTAALARSAA